MPEAAVSLVEAVDRYPRIGAEENRLTELFATVLRGDPELVSWLAQRAWEMPNLAESWVASGYRVSTQAVISDSARPDLQISFTGRARPPGNGRLFSEHKLGATETMAQKAGYVDVKPDDRLIAIKSAGGPPITGIRVVITWADVARKADQLARSALAGSRYDARRWRGHVDEPGTPAIQLRRFELIEYLRRKDPTVLLHDPLTTLDVATYARARSSLYAVRDLFALVVNSRRLDALRPADEKISSRMSFGPDAPSFESKEAKDSWYHPLRENWAAIANHPTTYWVELVIAAFDDWVPDPVGEPAIGVGYSFDLRDGSWPLGLGPDGRSVGALATHGITISEGPEDWIGRCFKTLYLGEVPSHGLSLADQAEWMAQWVCDALGSIEAQTLD